MSLEIDLSSLTSLLILTLTLYKTCFLVSSVNQTILIYWLHHRQLIELCLALSNSGCVRPLISLTTCCYRVVKFHRYLYTQDKVKIRRILRHSKKDSRSRQDSLKLRISRKKQNTHTASKYAFTTPYVPSSMFGSSSPPRISPLYSLLRFDLCSEQKVH